eukprot:gnl/TRDRNA2_/TRDRNA2_150354_c0_seq1.p2 gnl/TRDRNA2_/TRDRNA2_150354_c0~~gnl/TRDRNA2_/TRDRNA2_150354_c0_seq1.p2  ORF type:complete len:178 (+),score=12.20 gnl/TRDRNA2_/TRDRNA2_150354_c0_seq1:206-739(+)
MASGECMLVARYLGTPWLRQRGQALKRISDSPEAVMVQRHLDQPSFLWSPTALSCAEYEGYSSCVIYASCLNRLTAAMLALVVKSVLSPVAAEVAEAAVDEVAAMIARSAVLAVPPVPGLAALLAAASLGQKNRQSYSHLYQLATSDRGLSRTIYPLSRFSNLSLWLSNSALSRSCQ